MLKSVSGKGKIKFTADMSRVNSLLHSVEDEVTVHSYIEELVWLYLCQLYSKAAGSADFSSLHWRIPTFPHFQSKFLHPVC